MARPLVILVAVAPLLALLLGGFARRWMDDDGFINLRIVRNLLHGAGPVFNLDERVEAGTSPLWLGVVAILGALGVRLEHAAVFAGIALSGAGLVLAQDGASRLNGGRSRSLGERLAAAPLPIGAAIFAALPAVWDYASSGLETGLALAWLGGSFDAVARGSTRVAAGATRRVVLTAVLAGLGPLIRPEFAIYTVAFLFALGRTATTSQGEPRGLRSAASAMAPIVICAGALPLAYQIFRMGYYASTVPNTALAKEAFLANWHQGRVYFDNFFRTYLLAWPLTAAAAFWVARLFEHARARPRRFPALDLSLGLPIAAALHVVYVVRLGGDYMHGRLFVPSIFAALLPIMMAPASLAPLAPLAPLAFARVLLALCTAAIAVWVPLCAIRLRPRVENVGNIGDERGWYAREAHVDHPVLLETFRAHPFFAGAEKDLAQARGGCLDMGIDRRIDGGIDRRLDGQAAGGDAVPADCRRVYLEEEHLQITPAPTYAALASAIDPRVRIVLAEGAIGIPGYMFPASVHLADRHGLADPIVARFELHERGRPGHEKRISAAWTLARFAEPADDDDASVVAARHALHCGDLAALERAVTGPLTLRAFLSNLTHAWAYSRLRIPHDPFDAEARFCGTPPMPDQSTGGAGGTAFRWRCPGGRAISGLYAEFRPEDRSVSRVRPLCGRDPGRGGAAGETREGPTFGEKSGAPFEVSCPHDRAVVGIYGTSDGLVRSVGLVCSGDGAPARSTSGGVEHGDDFALDCPEQSPVVGIEGRAGDLLDSLGILCAAAPTQEGAAR